MKRFTLFLCALFAFLQISFAGGVVTNTNQSASWVRMPVRDASTDIDAVYYNPAGLTKLEDGFHFQINHQTLKQKREINNAFPYLNHSSYVGDVFIPTLPTAFLAYKKGNIVFAGGFAVVGGGGTADYKTGLPSFEQQISTLVPSLSAKGITTTKYSTDISFNGSSVYYGIQANVSYKINDMISVALGGRYVIANNSYKGHIRDIRINPRYPNLDPTYDGVNMILAKDFFNKAAQASTNLGNLLQSKMNDEDTRTIDQMQTAGAITAIEAAQIKGGLGSYYNPAMSATQALGTYRAIASGYTTTAAQMADKDVDTKQTGSAFVPIIGVNLSFLDNKINIGLKYEGQATLKVKNSTTVDDVKMFPDGAEIPGDMPAQISVGASYQMLSNFKVHAGFHYYFDRDANYGKKDASGNYPGNKVFIDDNAYEAALGIEFSLNPKLVLSVGYLYASTSPALAYQTDMSYSLKSSTLGFGGKYAVTNRFNLELGLLFTSYTDGEKEITYSNFGTFKELYYKDNLMGSIGISYRFGGND